MNCHRLVLVVAIVTGLGFVSSLASASSITLMDGSKLESEGTKLFHVDRSGKKALAKDGRYESKSGRVLLLQNGKLKELGDLRATPPAGVPPRSGPGGPEAWADKTENLTTSQDKITYTVDPSVKYGDKQETGVQKMNPSTKGKILQPPGQATPQAPAQQSVPSK